MARRLHLAWLFVAFLLLISAKNIEGKKRGGSSSSGWGLSSKSKSSTKSKPQQQTNRGGSQPDTIGWNVPNNNQRTSANSGSYGSSMPKPSAPSEHSSRSSSSNVQSGHYSNNAGQHGQYGGAPPSYGSATGGGYSGGYNSHAGAGYPSYNNPSGGYNPYGSTMGRGFSNNPGQGYNPSYGYNGGMGHGGMGGSSYSQPQTVVLQSQGRGFGQMAKEALVFAGINAGVNAAVNRMIPGGIYGHSPGYGSSSSGVIPPVSHTQITYNYYNGTNTDSAAAPVVPLAAPGAAIPPPAVPDAEAPGQPAAVNPSQQEQHQQQQSQNAPSPLGFIISDADLQKLSEELYSKDTNNAFQHITLKVQAQKTDDSITDDAPENLLEVKSEAYEIPTIKAVVALHDNYELDVNTPESVSSDERKEESDLLDAFMTTDVMKSLMKFLADKGYVPNDEYEFKDTLKRIWFSQFKRIDGEPSSSGFETVFLAEKFDNEIIGLHNWIYYAKMEEAKKLNYLGYIKKLDIGSNAAVIKGRSSLNEIVQPITTLFVGTSPELEMALYTVCFYTRPNNVCPMEMGGTKFLIIANRVNYFGKDIIVSGFPDI